MNRETTNSKKIENADFRKIKAGGGAVELEGIMIELAKKEPIRLEQNGLSFFLKINGVFEKISVSIHEKTTTIRGKKFIIRFLLSNLDDLGGIELKPLNPTRKNSREKIGAIIKGIFGKFRISPASPDPARE